MALKYIELPRNPLEMSREEIRSYLDGGDWSLIVRSLLMWELSRVRSLQEAGEEIEPRTLRSLWYTLIKPALDKLGALEKNYYNRERVRKAKDIGKIPDWAGLLSKYLSQLVEKGVTSYEELGIIDGSRQRQPPRSQSLQVNSVAIVGVHYPNIVLFTEKDTIYSIVASIASLYGVSVISGSGNPSYAATENLVKEMASHSKFATGSNIYILTLTDYDPAGYNISKAQIDQIVKVAKTLKPKVGKVLPKRLGLEPSQLTPEERAQNVYTPAQNGLRAWYKETGGVDGQPLGLELDSLPIGRIRSLFVDGIREVIHSEKPYHNDLAEALVELLIWKEIKPKVDSLRRQVWTDIQAGELLANLSLPEGTLAQFAKAGFSHIDPVRYDGHLFKAADRIQETIQEAIAGYD